MPKAKPAAEFEFKCPKKLCAGALLKKEDKETVCGIEYQNYKCPVCKQEYITHILGRVVRCNPRNPPRVKHTKLPNNGRCTRGECNGQRLKKIGHEAAGKKRFTIFRCPMCERKYIGKKGEKLWSASISLN